MRLDGIFGILISFLQRVCVKLITDYCGCLHYRHPFELGGMVFSVTLIWAQVSDEDLHLCDVKILMLKILTLFV